MARRSPKRYPRSRPSRVNLFQNSIVLGRIGNRWSSKYPTRAATTS